MKDLLEKVGQNYKEHAKVLDAQALLEAVEFEYRLHNYGTLLCGLQAEEKALLIENKYLIIVRVGAKECPINDVYVLRKLAELKVKEATVLQFSENDYSLKKISYPLSA